jgi:hypothetical protein
LRVRKQVGATAVVRIPERYLVGLPANRYVALLFFCLFVFGVGVANYALVGASNRLFYAAFTLISLMHFWYDSFIWSVRRADVRAAVG